ncbi:hypothetical protein OHT93_13160 [Streptomyces sp. NBC_00191]|uniref:hypothetical protein n=1 Tax=Streptomyces sp. NBC_00191 TaxID=2975674 RepID=UPI003248D8B1
MDEAKKEDAELPPWASRLVDAAVWVRTNTDLVWDRQVDGKFRAALVVSLSKSEPIMLTVEKNPGKRPDVHFGSHKPLSKVSKKPLR